MRIFRFLPLLALVGCSEPPVAATSSGRYRGFEAEGVMQFLGIRYGEAPVGDLRWRPPVPVSFVEGITEAGAYGLTAPQLEDDQEGASTTPMSEDCLFLNVFTPSLAGERPVIVFIHGGGWVNGGTIDPWYHAAHLAEATGLVVVTLDYRLGPLGFLDLSEQGGAEYVSSGNLGILDQQLAMRWVRDNIAAFGGDPDNVTLAGQSAGAQSVAMHMGLASSRPLFHKAVAMSGALGLLHTQATARATTRRFFEIAGVTTLDELRAKTWQELMEFEFVLEGETLLSDALFSPVLDGALFVEPPMRAIERGDAAAIPLLGSTTRDETRYWYYYVPYLDSVPPRLALPLIPTLDTLFDDAGREALVVGYEARHPTESGPELTMRIATDALFRMHQLRLAEAQSAHQPDTYLSIFDVRTTVEDGRYRSPHAADLPFFFRTFGDPSVDSWYGTVPPPALVDTYTELLESFARTGVPSAADAPAWPRFDITRRSTLLFDSTLRVVDDPDAGDRAVWDAFPFDSVTPAL